MSRKGSRSSGRAVLVSLSLLAATSVSGATPLKLNGWDAAAVERARKGAARKVESAECQKVFTDFADAKGRPLRQNLEEWNASPAAYIDLVPFLDGSSQPLCRKTKTALVANPGVRRVYVCQAFADLQLHQPGIAESMVIHEILHTLGLGENPPTSIEITQRVESRCR
jgi:hypothetical protein